MQNGHDVDPWHSRVPPGVPGAGWVIGIVFVFSVVTLGDWWLQGFHHSVAAPAGAAHSTKQN
jgi:hypothetical protein